MTFTVRAPAKINLHLGVGAPREDGFHPLLTVYQAVGICDDVTASPSAGWSLGVSVPDWMDADLVPVTGDNIVDRAARLLADHHGIEAQAEVSIAKSIPIAGGMAGGSADAAAALVALDRLWGVDTPDEDLLRIAADLGSDVPFALIGGTAIGTGRGELVEAVRDDATWWWVAVVNAEGMSTPAVYRHFDELNPDADPRAAGRRRPARGHRRGRRPRPGGVPPQRPPGGRLRPAPRPVGRHRPRRARGRAPRHRLRLRPDLRLPRRVRRRRARGRRRVHRGRSRGRAGHPRPGRRRPCGDVRLMARPATSP